MKLEAKAILAELDDGPAATIRKPTPEEVKAKVQREEYQRYLLRMKDAKPGTELARPVDHKNFWLAQHHELVQLHEHVKRFLPRMGWMPLEEFLSEITDFEDINKHFVYSDIPSGTLTLYWHEDGMNVGFDSHVVIAAMILYAVGQNKDIELHDDNFGWLIKVTPDKQVIFKNDMEFIDDDDDEEPHSFPGDVIDI